MSYNGYMGMGQNYTPRDRRFQSMFTFTKVPFWLHIFDPLLHLVAFPEGSPLASKGLNPGANWFQPPSPEKPLIPDEPTWQNHRCSFERKKRKWNHLLINHKCPVFVLNQKPPKVVMSIHCLGLPEKQQAGGWLKRRIAGLVTLARSCDLRWRFNE